MNKLKQNQRTVARTMLRTLDKAQWLIVMAGVCCRSAASPDSTTDADIASFYVQLNILVNEARTNSPALKSMDHMVDAAGAAIKEHRSLDPPQVGVEFYKSPVSAFPNPFKDQMEYDYSIQQMIPFPGKLRASGNAEKKRTDMLGADRNAREQDIVRNVKVLYFEIYLKYRQLEINHETHMLARELADIALKQYELGKGNESDVLRAQTELSTLSSDSIVLIQQRKSLEGMLNALCNRPVTSAIGFIPEIQPALPIRSGLRTMVVIAKGGGYFDPREIQIGQTAGWYTEVLSGVDEGEEIVVSSQFLIDAESNFKEAVLRLSGGKDGYE